MESIKLFSRLIVLVCFAFCWGCKKEHKNISSLNLATVTTTPVTNITADAATCGGNVISDGGAIVTARGVCWSTSVGPTISDFKTSEGTGTGLFASSLAGLTANTTYYVRAYAINSTGTAYGNQISFTTSTSLATITTDPVGNITATSATCGGNISNDGGSPISARGVCWSTIQSPTIGDSKSEDGTGTGSFTSLITGLFANTTYYIRSYATNTAGTSYGNQITFTTPDGLLLYLPFNGNANDESGNGNNGNVYNATLTTDRFGNPDAAYQFNGVNSYIQIAASASLSEMYTSPEFTITAWISCRSLNRPGYFFEIFEQYEPATGWCNISLNYFVYYLSLSKIYGYGNLQLLTPAGGVAGCNPSLWPEYPGWLHVAISCNSSGVAKFYMQGRLECSVSYSKRTTADNSNPYDIGRGRAGGHHYSDGKIDELRIYNRELTAAEILSLAN